MDDAILMLRVLINDITGSTYSNDTLTRLLLTSSVIVKREFAFNQNYIINLQDLTISPTPEEDFNLFISHKAAILLLQSEIRTRSFQSLKITDGPSSIDLTSGVKDLKSLLDFSLNQYDRMKLDYAMGDGSFGYAVITPTTVEYITASNFN